MGKIENSCFVPALIVGVIIGFLLSFFNVLGMTQNIWIPIGVVAIGGFVGMFLGKIIEMKWIDVGLPVGLFLGIIGGYFIP